MKWPVFRLLLLVSLSFRAVPVYSQTPGPADAVWSMPNPKDCGLITRLAGNQIGQISQGCLQSVYNAYYDDDWALKRRKGQSLYNPTPINSGAGIGTVKGLWPFFGTDGTNYLVAFSSGQMWYSNGNGAWTAMPGTNGLTASAEMECVQAFGKLWCTDGSDPVFSWDGASTATISAAPQGTLINLFSNRLWIAGVSGNLTQLYGSGFINGTDWALNLYPSISTSPVIIDVSGTNDGQKITCLMGEFQGKFLIGRTYDTFALAGSSNRDWTLYRFSDQVGCIEPKSAQEVNNALYWLSKRGIEQLTGTQINPVSYYIRPDVDTIISAAGNGVSKLLTSQADWQSGQLTASGPGAPISATISPGDIVVSTWGVTENSSSTFNSGQLTLMSTTTVSNSLSFFNSTMSFSNGDLSGGGSNWSCAPAGCQIGGTVYNNNGSVNPVPSSNNNNACQLNGNSSQLITTNIYAGSNDIPVTIGLSTSSAAASSSLPLLKSCSFTLHQGSGSGNTSFSCAITNNTCDTVSVTFDGQAFPNGYSRVFAGLDVSTFPNVANPRLFIKSNASNSFLSSNSGLLSVGNNRYLGIMVEVQCRTTSAGAGVVGPYGVNSCATTNYVYSSTYTSSVYDTGLSTPTWGILTASSSTDANTNVTFGTQVSASSNGIFDSTATVINGGRIKSGAKEFIKYSTVLTHAGTPANYCSTCTASVNNVILNANTTAYYITPCVEVDTPTSWGNLSVDGAQNGGSFTFWTSTGATCGAAIASTATWNSQTANAPVSVSTATRFIAERILFGVDVGTEVPTINDMTFNWNTGSTRPPVSSAQYLDRYYLFYTTSTVSGNKNDHALVYDFNGRWTRLDNTNAYSAALYQNHLYLGDSNATGNVFEMDQGYNDNGTAYSTSFQTADLDMGNPAQLKLFERVYVFLNFAPSATSNISLSCSYVIDGSTTSYSLGSSNLNENPENSGYYVAKFPFPANAPYQGHWINLSCFYSGTDGPIEIYGVKMVYQNASWE